MKMNEDCPRCKARGKTRLGDDPKCAFRNGEFDYENWHCATANILRDMVRGEKWNHYEDQNACLLTGAEESFHVLIFWYKNRGQTEGIWMVTNDGKIKPLTLTEAERIIQRHENQ